MRLYRAARSMPGRMRAMAEASVRPGRIRRELRLDELDAVHFPLTVMLPRVSEPPAAVSLLDIQHLFYPGVLLPGRAPLPSRLAYRRVACASPDGDRDQQARQGEPRRAHGSRAGSRRGDPPRARPRPLPAGGEEPREPFLLYPANPWPHKNHERLFEALTRLRREGPRAAARAHRHRPRAPVAARRGRGPGPGAARAARRALPTRVGARLPEPLRGVRPAAARGDGVRSAPSRARRRALSRRSAATQPATSTRCLSR